jgi:hypothetical protein
MVPNGATADRSCKQRIVIGVFCGSLESVFRSTINIGWVNVVKSTVNQTVNQSVVLVVAVGLVALFLF